MTHKPIENCPKCHGDGWTNCMTVQVKNGPFTTGVQCECIRAECCFCGDPATRWEPLEDGVYVCDRCSAEPR